MRDKLAALPVEVVVDEAGNQWATLGGASSRAVLIGGHIDSVPNGGWLDGCLNVVAGLEVLRRIAAEGEPPVTVRLVDWADEEGARFGRSLLGSSACAGSMRDQEDLRTLQDRDGVALPDALARVRRRSRPGWRRAARSSRPPPPTSSFTSSRARCSSRMDLPLGAVLGTFGVERHRVVFTGQAAHAGSTPMADRHDALAGAARLELEIREVAARAGGGAVCTMGSVVTRPGIVTSVAGEATCLVDQRNLDAGILASMLDDAKAASERFAGEERIDVSWERIWGIEPILFDETLVGFCDEAIREVAGESHRLPSGPLHDAAEVSRAGVPTVMLFVQSLRGLSHTKLEDTREEHLEASVRALDHLASKTMAWVAGGGGR